MKRFAGVLLLAVLGPTLVSSAEKEKTLGEPRQDAALVYLYRKSAMAGGARALHVFYDDRLVAVLRNNTYTFAYIEPGTHLFWDDGRERGLCDFAAGQTYYLSFHLVDGMSILSVSDGKTAIEKASRYIELTQEEQSKVADKIAKKWPKYRENQGSKLAPGGGEIAYIPPSSTEGMTKVAAGTPVAAELMENMNSAHIEPGASVWVRAAEDVMVAGSLFVRAGTPIKALVRGAEEKGHWRKGGKLDVTMVSVTAADGGVYPLIGQMATTGAKGSAAAANVAAAASLAGAIAITALTKGAQAFYPAGDSVKAFTRQDVWIKPVQATGGADSDLGNPAGLIKARTGGKIVCRLSKGEAPQFVDIVLESTVEIERVELVRVGGWEMPDPVRPSKLSRSEEGTVAQYEGWDLVRFLRPSSSGTRLVFRLTTAGGDVRFAQGEIAITDK